MSARENILARIRSANKTGKASDVIGGSAADRLTSSPISPIPDLISCCHLLYFDNSQLC